MLLRYWAGSLCLLLGMNVAGLAEGGRGYVAVDGKFTGIAHVYAYQLPDTGQENAVTTVIVASDKEIPKELRSHKPSEFALRDAGIFVAVMEFGRNPVEYTLTLTGAGVQGRSIFTGKLPADPWAVRSAERVQVGMQHQIKPGDRTIAFMLDIDTAPAVIAAKPQPNPADVEAARKAASTAAFLVYYDALRKGDWKTLATVVMPEDAALLKEEFYRDAMKIKAEHMASDLQVLKAEERGDTAELTITGTETGIKGRMGKAVLKKAGGRWLVESESWADPD
jgi:hypothetical protein